MSAPGDSLLGIQLDEYRIETPLGSGGMARVYRALDTKLQRYVALKVITSDFRGDDAYKVRFAREAQSIARLEHPNIVHIYRLGEANGLYYMVMKYVEGVDLARLIANYRNDNDLIPLEDTVRFVQEIGSALDYAHAQNVIHRDVKPSNIIIDQEGHAILTDFGLVFLKDTDRQDPVLGSPQYMAPEQAFSPGNVVPQTDLYSLGVTLFEMLTGELPFRGDEAMALAMQHLSEPPPPPSSINGAIPPIIDDVALRCLEKEPQNRYPTGAELSAALKHGVDIWTADSLRITQRSQRAPSQMDLTQKIKQFGPSFPLPGPSQPLPNVMSEIPRLPNLPSQQTSEFAYPGSAAQVPVNRQGQPQFADVPQRMGAFSGQSSQASVSGPSWFQRRHGIGIYLAAAVVILLLYACLILVAITILRGNGSQSAAILKPAASPTAIPASETPLLPTLLATPFPLPTELPETLLPLPTDQPVTLLPPTAVMLPVAPPDDRDNVPPGSRRLGEFAVEWYCNDQGFGVVLTNNENDWACTNPNGSIRFVLRPTDFDNICHTTYKNETAFAIRDQKKPIQAYNWSCYEYVTDSSAG